MRLYNPNKYKVEFRHGGKTEIMEPGESREFPEIVALHALERYKADLIEYHPIYDKEITKTDMDYDTMPWRRMVSLASARKIFKPGISRERLVELLKEYDKSETGTLQESFSKEEG